MIKVLVAEDELPLLRGIKHLIEEIDPDFTVVCCAANGQEALDYLSQHTVDIVFTDINMPLLDGLELLSQLAGRGEELHTVVISGYDNFQYAQKAMKLGTRSYLLKPIDKNELAELLLQFKSEIKVRSYTEKREKLLRMLFGGRQDNTAEGWGRLALYYLCAGPFKQRLSPDELPETIFWANGALLSYLRQKTRLSGNGEAWLFWGQNSNEALVILEDVSGLSEYDLMAFFTEQMEAAKFMAIAAGPEECEAGRMASVLQQLRFRVSRGAVFGKNSLIPWVQEEQEEKSLPDSDRKQIAVVAQKKQLSNLLVMLDKCKEYFIQNCVTQYCLEEELSKLFLHIQGREGEQWPEIQHMVQDLVAASADYEVLFHEVKIVCCDYLRGEPFDAANKESLMRSVDEYIRQNISRPFTTNELARHFGLVAPYLSKLFKCYKGMSPSQYMQSMRMERAQQILINYPEMLVKDIAEQLGYVNALYFSKVFQKATGIYPSEFRLMHGGKSCVEKE